MKKFLKFLLKLIIAFLTVIIVGILLWIFVYSDSFTEWCELRMSNVIEYYLDDYDGISKMDMFDGFVIATERTVISKSRYESKMIADAYRHYSWNYIGAQKLGEEKMQIIADNHEYAFNITDDVLDYFYARKDYYDSLDGISNKWFGWLKALDDCKSYSIEYRKEYALKMINDKENIKEYTDGYTVMDFINNDLGRRMSSDTKYKDVNEAFLYAFSSGELCSDRHTTEEEDLRAAIYLEQTKFE